MPRKLIIDTDPGIDDAMAIYLALASPELEVVGLTTVFGNVEVELATTNALRLLEIAGRSDIPVAGGAGGPIASGYHGPIPHIHGADGQGDTHLPPPAIAASDKTAVELLIEASHGERRLTILALGPLTNLARALQQDPGLAERVEEVVVMGGNALGPGNATPAAEANVWNDPEAADFVFGSHPVGGQTRHRPRLAMVGLDVTHEVVMSGDEVATLGCAAAATARHLGAVVSKYLSFFRQNHDRDGIVLHDPTAVVYLIDRSLFKTQRWPIRVEVEGLSRGKTWPALGPADQVPKPWQGRPLIDVCVEVEARKATDLVLERLTSSQD